MSEFDEPVQENSDAECFDRLDLLDDFEAFSSITNLVISISDVTASLKLVHSFESGFESSLYD